MADKGDFGDLNISEPEETDAPKAKIQLNVDKVNAEEVLTGTEETELDKAARTGKTISKILRGKVVEDLSEQDIEDTKNFLEGWNKASRGDLDFTKPEDQENPIDK